MRIAESIYAAVTRFHDLVDARTQQQETACPELVCPPDCCDCCRGSIFLITALDFAYLCRHVAEHFSPDEASEVVGLARPQYEEWGTDLAIRLESSDERVDIAQYQACPLLLRGRCRVYPARPTPCRLFGRTRFASGRLNLCDLLFRRLPAGKNGDAHGQRHRMLPVVETYSLSLAALLRRAGPDLAIEETERLVHVGTLPAFIAQTEFDVDRLLDIIP